MKSLLIITALVVAGWLLWTVFTAPPGASERAEQDEAILAGHSVTQSVPISNHPDLVPCPAPSDAPKDEQGWTWYCAKGTK